MRTNKIWMTIWILGMMIHVWGSGATVEGVQEIGDEVVFDAGEDGYACLKIPYLLATQAGSLLAMAEGRGRSCSSGSCSDFTCTDLVYKRSTDGGRTWGSLRMLVAGNNDSTGIHRAGNAAPVQLKDSGRILVPFTLDNARVFLTFSDDDGLSWSEPQPIDSAVLPDWEWVGLGPPGAIQLQNGRHAGRLVIPGYHQSVPLQLDGLLSHAHALYSDDNGLSWTLGSPVPDPFLYYSNENQIVERKDGSLLMNARSLLNFRVQAVSQDGGASWLEAQRVPSLPEPLGGCEGSTVRGSDGALYYSGLQDDEIFRFNLTLHRSKDEGSSWTPVHVLNPGASGYSALASLANGSLAVLYEWAWDISPIFFPDGISFWVQDL